MDCYPAHFREKTHDQAIFQAASSGLEYGALEVQGKIIVDIGAHIGGFTHFAVVNGAKAVHAFEPNDENFHYLSLNSEHFSQVVLNHAAVWWNYEDCLTSRQLDPVNTGGAFLENSTHEVVGLVRLQDYMRIHSISKIDVLKLDCEGSEFPILYSFSRSELSKISLIVGEYHNGYSANLFPYDSVRQPQIKHLLRFLSRYGFSPRVLTENEDGLGIFIAKNRRSKD